MLDSTLIMNFFQYYLVEMFSISIVILLVLIVRGILRKSPKKFSYVLWFAVILRILCPVTVQGIYRFMPNVETTAFSLQQTIAEQPVKWWGDGRTFTEESSALSRTEEQEKPVKGNSNREAEQPDTTDSPLLPAICFTVYYIGLFGLILYVLVSLVMCRLKLRDAILLYDNIYRTDRVDNSLVCGLIRPRIYINPRLLNENLDYVLAHERCHIRRRDYLVKPIVFILFSFLWVNPLIWVAYRCMMQDMEMSCDEWAMQNCDKGDRKAYSSLLLQLCEKNVRSFWQTPSFGGFAMKKRIQNVLTHRKPARLTLCVFALALIICGCGVISTPQKSKEMPVASASYQEKIMPLAFDGNMFGFSDHRYGFSVNNCMMDNDGVLFILADSLTDKGGLQHENELAVLQLDGEKAKKTEASWQKEAVKYANEKNAYFANGFHFMGGDGKLYLSCLAYDRQIRTDEEDTAYHELIQKNWYLLQVDRKTGKLREMPVPPWEPAKNGDACRIVSVFADGNMLITDKTSNTTKIGIYSGIDGSLLREVACDDPSQLMQAGDGFYYYFTHPQTVTDSSQIKLSLYREKTGELFREISLGGNWEKEDGAVGACYSKDEFYLYSRRGIFTAGEEDDEFQCVLNGKDPFYYMGDNAYRPVRLHPLPDEDTFYMTYQSESDPDTAKTVMCSYEKKE